MRISDWSSDVCSSDLQLAAEDARGDGAAHRAVQQRAANLAIPMRPQVHDAQDVELVSPADDLVVANGRAELDVADSPVGQRRHAGPRDRFRTIGRAKVSTPITNEQLVCLLLIEKKQKSA